LQRTKAETVRGGNENMTDQELDEFLGQPVLVKTRGGASFTGYLRKNQDGVYNVHSGTGTLENPKYLQLFKAEDAESVQSL
jgi:small nuclear ribonucleoprotein (snRNP)-like protein